MQLLDILPLAGKLVTADAMFTHRDICDTITDAGGDYVVAVKDNQENLHQDVAAFAHAAHFSPYEQRKQQAEQQTATTLDKGLGRVERRPLTSTTVLYRYLDDRPHSAQVLRVERERRTAIGITTEVACYITNLDRERAEAARLLSLLRPTSGPSSFD